MPRWSVRVTRNAWCDYTCEVYRGRFLIGLAESSSSVGAVKDAVSGARMRMKAGFISTCEGYDGGPRYGMVRSEEEEPHYHYLDVIGPGEGYKHE